MKKQIFGLLVLLFGTFLFGSIEGNAQTRQSFRAKSRSYITYKHHNHYHRRYIGHRRNRTARRYYAKVQKVNSEEVKAQYTECVNNAGATYGVDPILIFAMMKQESSYRKFAVSPKGASGLMQLMPATARRFGVKNIFDPCENIVGAVRYIKYLTELSYIGNNINLILAGYNAGEGAVKKYRGVPRYRETMNYVAKITSNYYSLKVQETVALMSAGY